ncbi:MAG: Rpn family recombination-promoting nuclease/putative transposase [Spirochaetia bacterium]
MSINYHFIDQAFKEIFANKVMLQSLLDDTVKEPWTQEIDIQSVHTENVEFSAIDKPSRSSDLLLRFSAKHSASIYLYLHLEFQTALENMGCRILEYLARIYQLQEKQNKTLFPVVPIVIYSSRKKWKESAQFINKFSYTPESMKKYIPAFKYFLVDIHKFADTHLREMKSAVSEFMLLEKTDFRKQEKAIQRIMNVLREIKQYNPEVFMLLQRYILGFMEKKSIMKTDGLTEYLFQQEEKGMLVESYFEVMEEKEKQGIERKAKDAAKRMLEDNMSIELIVKYTGLTVEEIEKLKE